MPTLADHTPYIAMSLARPAYGAAAARAELDAVLAEALRRQRDAATVRADAAAMRADIARHKPPAGPYDVKLVPGGLVDLEFAVHVLQLTTGKGLDPRLDMAVAALVEAGLLTPEIIEAEALLTRLLVTLRLVATEGKAPPEASHALVAQACAVDDWEALEARYAAARTLIAGGWRRIGGTE